MFQFLPELRFDIVKTSEGSISCVKVLKQFMVATLTLELGVWVWSTKNLKMALVCSAQVNESRTTSKVLFTFCIIEPKICKQKNYIKKLCILHKQLRLVLSIKMLKNKVQKIRKIAQKYREEKVKPVKCQFLFISPIN